MSKGRTMAKRLPVPPELEKLIEKREQEKDRRAGERRSGAKSPRASGKANGLNDRRQPTNRRRKSRRKADS
jgi:hypothetical protein